MFRDRTYFWLNLKKAKKQGYTQKIKRRNLF